MVSQYFRLGKKLRTALVVVLIVSIAVGFVLALIPRSENSIYPANHQETVCNYVIPGKFAPLQSTSTACQVVKDFWIQLSITASQNVTVSMWISQPDVNNSSTILYNYTGTRVAADLPIFENGTLNLSISNSAKSFSQLNGSFGVFRQSQFMVSGVVDVHPYRNLSLGLIGISAVLLFLVAWNPEKTSRNISRQVDIVKVMKKEKDSRQE